MLMSPATLVAYLPLIAEGARVTLALFLWTVVLSPLVAIPVALARNRAGGARREFGRGFILFFRGAPLLVILYLLYYGLPQIPPLRQSALWPLLRDPFPIAVLALALNSAGFQAEIIAGAMRNVPSGEVEAATAAGFSRLRTFLLVEAPHAIRIGLRSYGNELVFVLKGTAVVSFITIRDLMNAAATIYSRTFDPLTPLVCAGLVYLAIVFVIVQAIRRLEILLTPELRAARRAA